MSASIATPASSFGLPARIIVGAALGVLTGVVLGERAAVLESVGSAYGKMLEIAVFPYLMCSLLHGLARLTPITARALFAACWKAFLYLWVLTFGAIWLLSHAIPPPAPPTELVPASADQRVDLLT